MELNDLIGEVLWIVIFLGIVTGILLAQRIKK